MLETEVQDFCSIDIFNSWFSWYVSMGVIFLVEGLSSFDASTSLLVAA